MTTTTSAWDAAASVWADWEHLGTDFSMILPFLPALESPILVLGAGQGMLMENLLQAGYEVVGIDNSRDMIAEAQRRRNISIEYGSAEDLPFSAETFPTVIIQTGVLTERPLAFMQTVMREGTRVLKKGGHLVAGLILFSASATALYQKLGLVHEQMLQSPRFFELWRVAPDERAWVDLIAKWRNCTQAEAAESVANYREVLVGIYANWEQFAHSLRQQGQDPAPVLQALTNTPAPLFSFDDYLSLFAKNGLTVSESCWEPEVITLNLMGKK